MYAPKEAHEDRYIISAGIAIIVIVGMFVMLQISFYNGLRYALIQMDHVEKNTEVTNIVEGGEKSYFYDYIVYFRYKDDAGNTYRGDKFFFTEPPDFDVTPISVLYNPLFPQYYMFPEQLDDYEVDFWMSVGFLVVMMLAMIVIAFTVVRYIDFKKRMQRY
ncbi:MAG: hypothetical protein AAGC96_02465 [Pseudomonadota bacterium]